MFGHRTVFYFVDFMRFLNSAQTVDFGDIVWSEEFLGNISQ